jgi:hypothetical protein
MDICRTAADSVVIGCFDLFAVCLVLDATGRPRERMVSDYLVRLDALAGNGPTES